MTAGVASGFAGIWFASKGFSAQQIGVFNALPVFVMLALNLFVGRIADRANDWRQVIVIGAIASGLLSLGLLKANGFWSILLFWSLTNIAQMGVVPVADAAAMRITRRRGTDYGTIRAWATLGFTLTVLISGYVVLWYGIEAFLPLFVGFALLRSMASLGLPKFRAQGDEKAIKTGATHLTQVMKPWFLLTLLGYSVVFATHLILNAFQALLWKEQGISAEIIGILIMVGALAEAMMFFGFKRFATRFTARHLILISAAVSVFRWVAMTFSPGVEILFALQLLHAITFAVGFMGVMNFLANWTSEDIAAEAQGFFAILQQGTGVLALLTFGGLAGIWGAKAYFASAAIAAFGGILVLISLKLQTSKN